MGMLLCAIAFLLVLAARIYARSAGIGMVLAVGYCYGLLRANVLDGYSHLIFDAAVLSLYLVEIVRRDATQAISSGMKSWLLVLIGWPVLMCLMPMQHPLIQLVGLRGNILLLPFLWIGNQLTVRDADGVSLWIALLNLAAFALAAVESFVGIEPFFPQNAVTEIMYASKDLVGHSLHRIPASFTSAHAYAGTMVMTLPWLLGAQQNYRLSFWKQGLLWAAIMASLLGVFMAAARSHTAVLLMVVTVATFGGAFRGALFFGWLLLLGWVGYVISSAERLQRFLTLQDTDYVVARFRVSVNLNFLELLVTYPMGNGLGSASSIPYFLREYAPLAIGLENEYCRILLELGIIGVLVWIVFVGWFCAQKPPHTAYRWSSGCTLLWYTVLAYFGTGLLGVGLLTSIPMSAVMLLSMGWVVRHTEQCQLPPLFPSRPQPNSEGVPQLV